MKFNAKKQISALLALVLSLSLVQPALAAGVTYMPGVTADMSDAAYWADLRDDARDVILTPEEIEASRTHKTLPPAVELDADTAVITAQACAVLTAWMQAVNSRDAAKLTGEAKELGTQLADEIAKQTQKGQRERFERPTVHEAVVSAYERETGALTVTLSAQAVHYVASGGQLIRGREDLPEQMLWELQGNLTAQGWTPTCARLL